MRSTTHVSLAMIFALCASADAQILISNFGPTYTQDFDSLASSGTSTVVPSGWAFSESGSSTNTSYTAGTGSSTTGDTYSFGVAGTNPVTERAFGQLRSGALVSIIGARFQNTGPFSMTYLKNFTYRGEQWRLGATGRSAADKMDFQISTNATSLTSGTWTDFDAWDFTAPLLIGTTGAKDGNASGNFVNIAGGTFLQLPSAVASGGEFWVRWVDLDAVGGSPGGSDDGLGIDNISLQGIPEPSTLVACCLLCGAAAAAMIRRRKKRVA